ncbi:unnamed protein product [Pedinophyceae sp. YPF-701]|nr:unnamed protein product [Pedinophyceae sp. YPF-701]
MDVLAMFGFAGHGRAGRASSFIPLARGDPTLRYRSARAGAWPLARKALVAVQLLVVCCVLFLLVKSSPRAPRADATGSSSDPRLSNRHVRAAASKRAASADALHALSQSIKSMNPHAVAAEFVPERNDGGHLTGRESARIDAQARRDRAEAKQRKEARKAKVNGSKRYEVRTEGSGEFALDGEVYLGPERVTVTFDEYGEYELNRKDIIKYALELCNKYRDVRDFFGWKHLLTGSRLHRIIASYEWGMFLESTPPKPPGLFKGRGIVMPGGGKKYMLTALIAVRYLRDAGCKLPIELWVTKAEMPKSNMLRHLSEQGVWVRTMEDLDYIRRRNSLPVVGFALKAFSIMFSAFEEVIFLDSDVMALKDVGALLDSREYNSTGMILWPDYWYYHVDSMAMRQLAAVFGLSAHDLLGWRDISYARELEDPANNRTCWNGTPQPRADPRTFQMEFTTAPTWGCPDDDGVEPDSPAPPDVNTDRFLDYYPDFRISPDPKQPAFSAEDSWHVVSTRPALPTHDSSVMILDKARHWDALSLYMYQNFRFSFFHRMTVPNERGIGDKETLAMAMRALRKPYHLVGMAAGGVGNAWGSHTMIQFEPGTGDPMFLHRNCYKWSPDSPGVLGLLSESNRAWKFMSYFDPRRPVQVAAPADAGGQATGWSCAVLSVPEETGLSRDIRDILPFDAEARGADYAREVMDSVEFTEYQHSF